MFEEQWVTTALTKANEKMKAVNQRNIGKIPYSTADGQYDNLAESFVAWWTNGFFSGSLWQLYHYTGDVAYRENAETIETLLDTALEEYLGLHHDVGFMWLHTAVADYRLTGSKRARERGLHAASLLLSRFNPVGKYLSAWNCDVPGWAIIDSMMNIPILYWASEELKDPRFRHVAKMHADTLAKYLVRPDGSAGHIASFDPESGEFLEMVTGQGYSPESSWTRGQSWGIYGFALSYRHTHEERYLATAKQLANYFIANVAQTDYVSLVDFRAPLGTTKLDTSATACAACGLLEIAEHTTGMEAEYYRAAAEKMLLALVQNHCDWQPARDGILQNSSQSYHQEKETHVNFVYGDYFLLEGLLRLIKQDCHLW